MEVMCIDDVVTIENGQICFTKGNSYKAFRRNLMFDWDVKQVLRAKNDHGEQHIINYLQEDKLDDFFQKHFIIVKGRYEKSI